MKKAVTAANEKPMSPILIAHLAFHTRLLGLKNKADVLSRQNAESFVNTNEKHFRNAAYINTGEVAGIKQVLRIYGGKDNELPALPMRQRRKMLDAISTIFDESQTELEREISQQSFIALTSPENSRKHSRAQKKLLHMHGELVSFQKAQYEFQKLFLNFF